MSKLGDMPNCGLLLLCTRKIQLNVSNEKKTESVRWVNCSAISVIGRYTTINQPTNLTQNLTQIFSDDLNVMTSIMLSLSGGVLS